MHPLLRTFLQRKLEADSPRELSQVVGRAATSLIGHELWDEAFELMQRFDQRELLPDLIAASMERAACDRPNDNAACLDRGSSPECVDGTSRESRARSSRGSLLRVGVACGAGGSRSQRCPGLARHAQTSWRVAPLMLRRVRRKPRRTTDKPRRSPNRPSLFAERNSESFRLRSNWSIAATCRSACRPSAPVEALDPEEQVILADRTLGAETRFGLPVDLPRGRAAQQLLRFVADPMTRTSFRNVFGYTLAATANFDEAMAIIGRAARGRRAIQARLRSAVRTDRSRP